MVSRASITMKDLREQVDGQGFLFNMPRPKAATQNDGERMGLSRKQYANAKKWRCQMTSFPDQVARTSPDMSYRDSFNRSMSCQDKRYVGLAAAVYPKMSSPLNKWKDTVRSRPGPGSFGPAGSNVRLIEGPLAAPINF